MNYQVLIVDDKPLIRRSLKETIDWKKLNCVVAGEAQNGKEAVELVKKFHPELVISDIKMPGMDGLELTEFIKKESPDTQVIIITGYQEFEYARKALSLGVIDLVLKPLRNEDMENKIAKAIQVFQEQTEMKEAVRSVRQVRTEKLLYRALLGNKEDFSKLGIYRSNYSLLLVRARADESEKTTQLYGKITEWFRSQETAKGWKTYSWMLRQGQVILLIDTGSKSAREWKISLKQGLFSLEILLENEHCTQCCFVVSKTCNDFLGLSECLENISEVMERRYFFSDENILFTEHDVLTERFEVKQLQNDLEELKKEVLSLNEVDLRKKLSGISDEILNETNGDEFRIKCILSEFCMSLEREVNKGWEKRDTDSILDKIGKLSGKQECAEFLKYFVSDMKTLSGKEEKTVNPVAREAISYIKNHYQENFSQTELAEKLGVNPSYLSRLLKKDTGHNFMEILTECRISRAKELLLQPGTKVVEVCSQVGYPDYTYFYQVFKKAEGISPSEYKKQVKKPNIM